MLETYQEADQYRKSISPLLKGRLDTGLAEAHSNFGQEDEAHHFLERAYKTFPETPKDDPNFSYTHFKLPQGFEVVMHLNLKQADKAWAALTKLEVSIPREVVPDRVELSIDQARASLLLGDMKLSCTYVEYAATSASALGSHLRYAEAHRLYQQMYIQWPREQQVQALARHFH
jgi:tetratricopeptide (TPR) repeat protein